MQWVHGGLENQITHHLLPRLPRPNLRRATQRVKAWAAEAGVEFQEKSFSEGNTEMTGMLAAVASQARAYNAKVRELARGECHLEI
jgi:delta8-fatty-acid desaturase